MKETPFACNMSSIEPSQRVGHIEIMKELFQSVHKINQVQNGFKFLSPNENNVLINLMTFIDKERLCCPFFSFKIEIEAEGGNVWLQINGREGVKEFIKEEFSDYINREL